MFTARINEQGKAKELRQTSGPVELADAARAAVSQWEYEPIMVEGQAKEFLTVVQIDFVLPK